MDFKGRIDSFCQKICNMAEEISADDIGLSVGASKNAMNILITVYRNALDTFSSDEKCSTILNRMYEDFENNNIQEVFYSTTEDDIYILGNFAEQYINAEKLQEAIQMFQFLTLLCPKGMPNPYTYLRLAESLTSLNIDAGLQMYDFVLNIFPDNPAILISAAKTYEEGERPKKAIRVLTHAKTICEGSLEDNPDFKEFLDILNPELDKLQKIVA